MSPPIVLPDAVGQVVTIIDVPFVMSNTVARILSTNQSSSIR